MPIDGRGGTSSSPRVGLLLALGWPARTLAAGIVDRSPFAYAAAVAAA
jgi:hypothetical protein